MSAAKPKFTPKPRCWTDVQIAARFGCSVNWLSENKRNLYQAGMPQPDQLLGGKTDAKALEAWLDRRSGLIDAIGAKAEHDPFAERIEGGQRGQSAATVHRLPAR